MDDSYCTTPTSNPFLHYNTCQQTDLLYHTPVKATARPQYHENMMYHHEHMKSMQHALQKTATAPVAYSQSYPQLTQFPFHHQQHHHHPAYSQGIMTPLSTPQPSNDLRHARFYLTPRPFALKTDCSPTTPPLSANISADSTPPSSYDYLPTPMYSAPIQWLKSQSRPATPIYEYPSAMTSFYSSPSPVDSQPPCEQESFCDPREVFGDSMNCYGLTTPLDGSLPVLGSSVLEAPQSKVELELDGFFNIPFTSDAGHFSGFNKRQRSDMLSFASANDECLFADQLFDESEDDTLAAPWVFVPTESAASFCSDMSMASFHAQTAFDANSAELAASQVVAASGTSAHSVPSHTHTHAHSHVRGPQNVTTMPLTVPVPVTVNRRGRKPSLTEDPSKTFVCHLCARRFRRQEHLKRHYRSLHTHEKPFKCGECNKVFSRSDNLSQHQRTHGTGSFPLDVVDANNVTDAEADEDDDDDAAAADTETEADGDADVDASVEAPELDDTLSASPESDSDRMAKILYQAARRAAAANAAAAEASDSTLSDDQIIETGSPVTRSMRKRARSD